MYSIVGVNSVGKIRGLSVNAGLLGGYLQPGGIYRSFDALSTIDAYLSVLSSSFT